MTTEQTARERGERQHQALMAVTRALTPDELARILARSSTWPGMNGAGVADVLDMTVDYDEFLAETEPFYEEHHRELGDNYGTVYAVHALILLRRPLTVEAALELLTRAGLRAPVPYDPFGDLAKIIYEVRRMPGPFTADLADAIARLKDAGAWGTPYVIEARLRSLAAGGQ